MKATTKENPKETNSTIDQMFKAGAHFGLGRSRRHPSIAPYIFGVKNNVEIFDLEKTKDLLASAKEFVKEFAKDNKVILFVGGKSEARAAVKLGAQSLNMPFVDGRWIGGTLTNFGQIRKRVEKLEKLISERDKGEFAKHTKRERMLLDKEIENLEKLFSGIVSMKELPKAVFIVDPKKEKTAIKEAQDLKIPVVALSGSDCNITGVNHPVLGNDASQTSVSFFVNEIVKAYNEGKGEAKKA